MKLRRVRIQNVRSFLEPEELLLDGDLSILIGPNGGGKTNLLDCITTILRRHILSSWSYRRSPTEQQPDQIQMTGNDMLHQTSLDPHFLGAGLPQSIEIEVEATPSDLHNMMKMRDDANRLGDVAQRIGAPSAIRQAHSWDLQLIRAGDKFVFKIDQNSLQPADGGPARQFLEYLTLYEQDGILRDAVKEAPLSTPMLSLPVNRAMNGFQTSISLSGFSDADTKKQVDAASSKVQANITALAVGRIAQRHRLLLDEDRGNAMQRFLDNPQMQSLTRVLQSLGYGWKLVSVNPMTNQYDIQLSKQGSSFFVGAASSGEKELLTYLFGIYALNVHDALVVIDEPELHLHPRWQKALLSLLETLTAETGNQFLIATHSPVFVSASSIQYVSRVFSEVQRSKIIRMNSTDLPGTKHLFSIVNSQNNERMFFTDYVVLVEGISDRLVFGAIFDKHKLGGGSPGSFEVIDVGGKHNFDAYKKVLAASKVRHAVIADLDYVNQIGTPELRGLFRLNGKKVEDAIGDPASKDGQSLVDDLEQAISTGDLTRLQSLWKYVKERRSELKPELTAQENQSLDDFIRASRNDALYILRLGSLEKYLPLGYRAKEVGKVIRLLENPGFWDLLPGDAQAELLEITQSLSDRYQA